jgi:hypothetical protein
MDFWLVAYIFISAILGSSLVSFMYKQGQTIGAIGLVVLLLLIYVFYGLRWFKGGNLKGTTVDGKIPWPPIINACPDFMSSYKASDGKIYCYDAGNFYDMKIYDGAGQTTVSVNGLTQQKGILMKDPSRTVVTEKYPLRTAAAVGIILSDGKGKYVKWEGIIDGTSIRPENLSKAPMM